MHTLYIIKQRRTQPRCETQFIEMLLTIMAFASNIKFRLTGIHAKIPSLPSSGAVGC